MREFFLSTRISKILSNSDNGIKEQLDKIEQIITEISAIDPIFKNWYINNPIGSKPPYDYPFPSDKAHNYLFNLRKNDLNESFLLWNGRQDNSQFASFRFDRLGLVLSFSKILETEQMIQLFKTVLEYPRYDYAYLNTDFFYDITVFPHRLETASICYVPVRIEENYLPHLYQKVEIDTEYNQGTILVFDKNWADETNDLKKKVQENSIALVELGVIPETELPEGFFES